jgi:hypothetical protein
MVDALEMAGKILHLPALFGADLLAQNSTAGAGPLFGAEIVLACGDGEIFEVGKTASSLAPFHSPQFLLRLGMRWNIVRVDCLAIQLVCEVQQQLCQILCVLKPIRAWPVVLFLVTIQFYLQAQVLDLEIIGAPLYRVTLEQ